MKFTRYNQNQNNPFAEFDQPFFGLSLLPFEKALTNSQNSGFLSVDVSEDKDNVYIKADLPGLKKEDVHVSLENDVLTIKGERRSENEQKDKNYHRVERSYGVFERRILLGVNVDETKIKAVYKDGVLDLTLPKSEVSKVKRIEIKE